MRVRRQVNLCGCGDPSELSLGKPTSLDKRGKPAPLCTGSPQRYEVALWGEDKGGGRRPGGSNAAKPRAVSRIITPSYLSFGEAFSPIKGEIIKERDTFEIKNPGDLE